MSNSGVQGITETDIANYLANTPGFFERHAELLGSVQLTSPHGQRAVSLQERQMEMLRDKIRGLEGKIIEMIRYGQDNVSIADRLHRWTRALLLTPQPADLPATLVRVLMHQYMIPEAGIRIWGAAAQYAAHDFAQPVGEDIKLFAGSLSLPYCGVNSGFEAAQWLQEPTSAKSMALIPLRADLPESTPTPAFGMLVLASPDPTRYTADMGTEFLMRIGEIAGAALSRLLPARG
jgi:uncharacterized protein YigA (DUF484 family)